MDPFNFDDSEEFEQNDENDNLIWKPKHQHKFKKPVEGSFVRLEHEIIVGEKINCKFL